jgi:hypothetical protein
MPVAAEKHNEVEIGRFRKRDFEDLEKWAEELGVSTDELSSQIVRMATHYMSLRRTGPRFSENVVPFGPPK